MCGLTGVSWVLQRLVLQGCIDWNRSGWIIQNVSWQPFFPFCSDAHLLLETLTTDM